MELVVTAFGESPTLATNAETIVRDGYPADIWLLCEQLFGQHDDEMLVQLQNEDGDNWLVAEKGLKPGVLQQDCVYITAGRRTDAAVLVEQYGAGSPSGVQLRRPVGDMWLPKSQLTMFEPKNSSDE